LVGCIAADSARFMLHEVEKLSRNAALCH
jgi:hypothetical protein